MKTDKLLHLLSGYVITITIGLWLPLLGLLAGIVAGAGKELLWDKLLGKGTPELLDAVATIAGSMVAYLILMIA